MRTRTFIGLLSCICLVLCLYITPVVSAATAEEEVRQVITNWAKASTTSDFKLFSCFRSSLKIVIGNIAQRQGVDPAVLYHSTKHSPCYPLSPA